MRRFDVIFEFCSALFDLDTYNPRRNPYMIFGFLWGLPVPILGYVITLHVSTLVSQPLSLADVVGRPFFMFLLLHPFLFAAVFGAMGTVRLRKIERIENLLEQNTHEMHRLAQAHAELKRLTRLKEEMLGNVTHELKTPLVTLRGYADMLDHQRLGPLNEKQQRAMRVMIRNCQRLQDEIEMMLASSRNQSRIENLHCTVFPIRQLLSEVKERHRLVAREKHIHVTYEAADPDVRIWGDPARIGQALDNLVSNAIKFTDPGGKVRLVFGKPSGDRLPVEVSDTGCGIEAEAQGYIFERFRQADGSIRRRYGGSGLGLAIVRANLQAHGCDIRVESRKGEGTRFLFELPLEPTGPEFGRSKAAPLRQEHSAVRESPGK